MTRVEIKMSGKRNNPLVRAIVGHTGRGHSRKSKGFDNEIEFSKISNEYHHFDVDDDESTSHLGEKIVDDVLDYDDDVEGDDNIDNGHVNLAVEPEIAIQPSAENSHTTNCCSLKKCVVYISTIFVGFFSTVIACVLFFFANECVVYFLNGKSIVNLETTHTTRSKYQVEYDMWTPRVTFLMIPIVFIFNYSSFYVALYVFGNNLKTLYHYAVFTKSYASRYNIKRYMQTALETFTTTDSNNDNSVNHAQQLRNSTDVDTPQYYNNDPPVDSNGRIYDKIGGVRIIKNEESFDCYRCIDTVEVEIFLSRHCVGLNPILRVFKWMCIFLTISSIQFIIIKMIINIVFGSSWNTDARTGYKISNHIYFGYPDVLIFGYLLIMTPCLSVLSNRFYHNITSHIYSKYI